MYTESHRRDAILFAKAFVSNQIARFAPAAYMRLTRQTGRGEEEQSAREIADYFISCVDDYRRQLGLEGAGFGAALRGRTVLEYGPGDILGVALLLYAHGAQRVDCVDRFPLHTASAKNLQVYRCLLDSLQGAERARADAAFNQPGRPESGLSEAAVRYLVRPNGLSGARQAYDLVISRAVLEHVNDLEGTVQDIANALKPDGTAVHQVDLRSHGLDRYKPFDFLTWPEAAYRLMFSRKGFPNRWRANKYRELVGRAGLKLDRMEPTARLDAEAVARIRHHVARTLGPVSPEELSWTGFWMVLRPATATG